MPTPPLDVVRQTLAAEEHQAQAEVDEVDAEGTEADEETAMFLINKLLRGAAFATPSLLSLWMGNVIIVARGAGVVMLIRIAFWSELTPTVNRR